MLLLISHIHLLYIILNIDSAKTGLPVRAVAQDGIGGRGARDLHDRQ